MFKSGFDHHAGGVFVALYIPLGHHGNINGEAHSNQFPINGSGRIAPMSAGWHHNKTIKAISQSPDAF
ncbi:MAG: hypothetical protein GY859_25270 [Desulfobacterales bacterium]|nr:hypothetical protein [Desulfobacterales bacterium]